ncbi:Hypothetical protein NTJ_08204 [Nesidiocoris tenuis]|uniref:Uncharacterized protein n=1 Tax=Nesidiocoris tenuis TaxID=355587 RepID=A0ABN7ATW4_9HEMI|nr:Hypothetical protein NTJ_08204 [Nesidiocoris tenuis]
MEFSDCEYMRRLFDSCEIIEDFCCNVKAPPLPTIQDKPAREIGFRDRDKRADGRRIPSSFAVQLTAGFAPFYPPSPFFTPSTPIPTYFQLRTLETLSSSQRW